MPSIYDAFDIFVQSKKPSWWYRMATRLKRTGFAEKPLAAFVTLSYGETDSN